MISCIMLINFSAKMDSTIQLIQVKDLTAKHVNAMQSQTFVARRTTRELAPVTVKATAIKNSGGISQTLAVETVAV